MTVLGLDYAGGVPHPTAITSGGYSFVVRYLTAGGRGLPGKLLTAGEYQRLQAAGIGVVLNWETTADRMKGGRDAGISDARTADSVARSLGVPDHRPIYFSADWDASAAEQGVIDAYLRGAATVIGADRVGVYGSYYVVKRCLDNGTAQWAWQTGAWSRGQREPRAHIYQRIGQVVVGGVQCDVNEARCTDFGQHPCSTVTSTRHARETPMWPLARTTRPTGYVHGDHPDTAWPDAVEDTITLPGPAGGWSGRTLVHFTPGFGGAWIQEAHWQRDGQHVVPRETGLYVAAFDTQGWEAPRDARSFVIRYATANGGSIAIETEH